MSLLSSKKSPSDCEAQCSECGAILSRLADMNRHRKTKHPDGTEMKFPCPWFGCGYLAIQKGNLKSHIDARHSNGPKYHCPECPRRFTDAAARIRHRKKMHGYVPYHTAEYLARQARSRRGRMVQETGEAVSSHRQQVLPNASPNASSSVPTSAPKLTEVAYYDVSWKMPVDTTHLYPQKPAPSRGGSLFLPFEMSPGFDIPNFIQGFPSPAKSPPLYPPQPLPSQDVPLSSQFQTWHGYPTPDSIQSFPSPGQAPSLYLAQPQPSQDVPLSSPFQTQPGFLTPNSIQSFPSPAQSPSLYLPPPQPSQDVLPSSCETWPGYATPNYIQDHPSPVQSLPSVTSSDFTIDYYPNSHGPQLYTMQSQEQQFGESLTGDYGPPYNGDGQWNWQIQ